MSAVLQGNEAEKLLEAAIRGELPDERGRFGPFGGRYVPETLVPAFERLGQGVKEHLHEPSFQEEFRRELREWVGRPTALTYAPRLSAAWGADVWLKREDLAHTGAHKINNAIGQALLAKRLGAERVIAETGAGQHGVASAAACARVGLPCSVYMGAVDMERQAPDVPLLGEDIGLIGVEAGGTGTGLGQNAATLATGTPGVLQGSYTIILQDDDGQVQETHSISAGLDYSGVGPEHAMLQATGRVKYISAEDDEALEALEELCALEGILTALETSHAFAAAKKYASENPGKKILIGNSGRGDKDMPTLTKYPARIRSHAGA